MRVFLVDNGSLRGASYLNLECVAAGVEMAVGERVEAASLLHSDRIDPAELGGRRARTLEPAMEAALAAGERDLVVLPFFIGPSRALTDYIPERVEVLRARHGDFRFRMAVPLFDGSAAAELHLAEALCAQTLHTIGELGLVRPPVALVDHGTPVRAVTEVRNRLAARMAEMLGAAVAGVAPCSMERREGAQYDFNEPLLERLLDQPGYNHGDVVVAMLFLSPGRHAGPGGDVAEICAAAQARHHGLRCRQTPLLGEHPLVVRQLAEHLRAALRA